MKSILFLIFSMVGIFGFGQDCGCMEAIWGETQGVKLLENPEDYEQDSFYLQVIESEVNEGYYWFYLINNTASAITLENESTAVGGSIIVESKDSLGEWKAINYSGITDYGQNYGFLHIPKNYYASILLKYTKRSNPSFQTKSRFKMTFRNQVFYSEPFADTIDYCQFVNPIFYINKGSSKEEIAKYAERILNEDEDCTVQRIKKYNSYFSGILIFQAHLYFSEGYEDIALKLLNIAIENDLYRFDDLYFKAYLEHKKIELDTINISNDDIRLYIANNYLLNNCERFLNSENPKGDNFSALQKSIKKLKGELRNKIELQNLNYQDYITTIGGEEYFKIDCLGGELTKVRFKEE